MLASDVTVARHPRRRAPDRHRARQARRRDRARWRSRPTASTRARHARCSQAAIERGGTWLFTGDRSEANLRLYRRHGFEETHREPVPGHTLVYLKRPGA